ncbi:MAG: hypothetical protein PHW27_12245 [Melioribacteraceae bacterium]|nr:hypothetical protein [Melioribacteraceae bacterium]MDD3559328.1 hypothetical protein [Melioribacteraceae bacterium]
MNNLKIPKSLVDLIENNQLGSRELLSILNSKLLSDEFSIDQILSLIPYLKSYFPHFQNIQKYLAQLEKYLRINNDKKFLIQESIKLMSIAEKIFSQNKNVFENLNSFVTLSNSSTIEDLMKIISRNKEIELTISESRPVCEGVILAERLSKSKNIIINLCTEAQLPSFVSGCDAVLLGADKILSDGRAINKVGSKLLGILARNFEKPFYIAADKSKFSKDSYFEQPQKPEAEIYPTENNLINITNEYFEIIDSIFITSILTD